MPVANTVETTIRSRYLDGVTEGLRRTQATIGAFFNAVVSQAQAFAQSVAGAFTEGLTGISDFGSQLMQMAGQAKDAFGAVLLAVAGAGLIVVAWLTRMGAAAVAWTFEVVTQASKVTELKLAYESLSKAAGIDAAASFQKLRVATDGLVKDTVLLRNANRVLTADIPITFDQYTRLVENIFKLSKTAGVEAPRAIDALTDAVIKGNAGALQSLGMNLRVKGAIDEVAAALGQQTSKLDTDTRLRVFYNQLLGQTSAAIARNRADYFSLADAVEKSENFIQRWKDAIGEGISRSKVFSETLNLISAALSAAVPTQRTINILAVSFNVILVETMRSFEILLRVAQVWFFFINAQLQTANASWQISIGLIATVLAGITGLGAAIVDVANQLAKLAGINSLDPLSAKAKALAKDFENLANESFERAKRALQSIASGGDSSRLGDMAREMGKMREQVAKYALSIVQAADGTRQLSMDAGNAAQEQKKLREELEKYQQLLSELRGRTATPEQAALAKFMEDLKKIDALTSITAEQRRTAQIAALKSYEAEVAKINAKKAEEERARQEQGIALEAVAQEAILAMNKAGMQEAAELLRSQMTVTVKTGQQMFDEIMAAAAKRRAEEQQRAINDAVGAAQAIARAVQLSQQGKIDPRIGVDAMRRSAEVLAQLREQLRELQSQPIVSTSQIDDILRLKEAIEKLNSLNLSGALRALEEFRQFLAVFAKGALESFGNFLADLVSGQENSGKKFVAALLGMVADGLQTWARYLAGVAIAKAALFDFGGAAKAAAGAAAVFAAAGIARGLASNLAQTNQAAGSAGSFQTSTPRPIGGSTQPVVNVGRPTSGPSPAAQPISGEITIRLEAQEGFVAREVKREIRGNRDLRDLIIQVAGA